VRHLKNTYVYVLYMSMHVLYMYMYVYLYIYDRRLRATGHHRARGLRRGAPF
jgi:hypothetical protein